MNAFYFKIVEYWFKASIETMRPINKVRIIIMIIIVNVVIIIYYYYYYYYYYRQQAITVFVNLFLLIYLQFLLIYFRAKEWTHFTSKLRNIDSKQALKLCDQLIKVRYFCIYAPSKNKFL